MTTIANASLRADCRPYLLGLESLGDRVLVMTSAGGLVPISVAAGPPGRARCSADRRAACALPACSSTCVAAPPTRCPSTWAARARTCASSVTASRRRRGPRGGGLPIRFPSLDILTIGAGGGSIARLDLRRRPRRRAAERGRRSRTGLLRPGRHGADGHRRGPGARAHSRGHRASRTRPSRHRRRRARRDRARRADRGRDRPGRRREHGARGPRGDRRARGRRARRSPWSRSAARGRCTHARWRRRSGCPPCWSRRARACSRRWDWSRRRRSASSSGRGPNPADHAGIPRGALPSLGREVAALEGLAGQPAEVETFLDCRYAGQSHELTVGRDRRLPGRARSAQRLRAVRASRSRSSRCARPGPVDRPRSTSPSCPPWPRRGGRRTRGRREPDCTVWVPTGWTADARPDGTWVITRGAVPSGSGVVAGADLAAHGRRGGDGRGAAARRVQPEHQGARRLLGRALHRGRRAARAGRAHPGPPRLDARGRARRDRRVRRRGRPRRPDRAQRSLRRRHAPERRHARRALLRRRPNRRVGREPGPSRGPRGHGAGLDAARRGATSPRRACGSRRSCSPTPWPRWSSRSSRTPGSAGATSTRRSVRTGSASHGSRSWVGAAVRRDRRLRRAPDAGRAARDLPDGRWRAEDVLDSTGPRPEQQRPGPHRGRDRHRRRRGDVRLHRDRRPAPGHGERGRGGDRQRGRVRPAHRDRPDDPGERRRAATGPRGRDRRARSLPRGSRPRSVRATSR